MRLVPPTPAARAATAATLAVCALALTGCKSSLFTASPFKSSPFVHRAEKRAVNGFAEALAASDPERLAGLTSDAFRSAALADEEAIAEVRRIWPAAGELEVVSVKDVPDDELREAGVPEKLVTVKDERGWKTDHRLIRDPRTKKWVVDDILITRTQRGVTATKTVSEQVVFVTVVREFTEAWRGGDRERRLAGVTAECRAELEPLPDDVLDHLAGRMFPADAKDGTPDATMDDDIAFVRIERPTAAVVLQMKRIDGRWLVDDAALEAGRNGETIPSLRKTAVAYAAAAKFLAAYAAPDRAALATVAAESFFDATLKAADLSSVSLPPASAAEKGRLKVVGEQGELVIEDGDRTVQIALVQTNDAEAVDAATEFRVEDVTLYEDGGRVKKRLAAALVAVPMAHLYADALLARDVAQLGVMATGDFKDRVWDHVRSPEIAAGLPIGEVRPGRREVLSVVHNGAATEVTMMQADRAMTFVLKDEGGAVKIDDVLLAVSGRPASLKTTLVHMLPVARLRAALAAGDVDAVRAECSSDFNRLIWSQVRRVPPAATAAARFLGAPLSELEVGATEATIRLGDPNFGGAVALLEEQGRWKIHDVTVVAGPGPAEQAALKPLLRDALANGSLFADSGPSGTPPVTADAAAAIRQVSHETASDPPAAPQGVEPKEPRPLDLGTTTDLAPEAQSEPPAAGGDGSALPFSEPLW